MKRAILLSGCGAVLIAMLSGSVHAEEGSSRIYALFLCVRSTGTCTKQVSSSPLIFDTLVDCHRYVRTITTRAPDAEGHFAMSADLWFECRSKRVDTWEPEQ
jgi:hypothetical protein